MTSNRIKALRDMRGWSQEELGARLGTNKHRISRLESGDTKLDLPTALQLAEVFDVSLIDVVDVGERSGIRQDAEPYAPGVNDPLARLADPSRQQSLFLVKTRALENIGIGVGDVLLVDCSPAARAAPPTLAGVVCEAFDEAGAPVKGTTMLRQFVPPCMLITTSGARNMAFNLHTDRVRIVGVVISRHHPVSAGYRY